MRYRYTILLLIIAISQCVFGQTNLEKAHALLQQLENKSNINTAASELTLLGRADPEVTLYLNKRIPALIADREDVGVWEAEVQLAGDLKLDAAIPELAKMLTADTTVMGLITIHRFMKMENDPPAKALIAIGDPAIPDVTGLLGNPDSSVRSRAIRVLINIDSAAARDALAGHLPDEKDPPLQRVIKRHL